MPVDAGLRGRRRRRASAELRVLRVVGGGAGAGRCSAGRPTPTLEAGLAVLGEPAVAAQLVAPRSWRSGCGLLESELADGALGHRGADGVRAADRSGRVPGGRRAGGPAGAPTYTHVRELVEADPTTPDRRLGGDRRRGGRDRRRDAPLPRQQHLAAATSTACSPRSTAPAARARASPSRPTPTARAARRSARTSSIPTGSTCGGCGRPTSSWCATGERIARRRPGCVELRSTDPGAECIVEFLDEQRPGATARCCTARWPFPTRSWPATRCRLSWPDGTRDPLEWPLPPGGSTHPRSAGTFAKTLRLMVRETATWTWLEAFRRCSYLPARVLDDIAPAARGKGRLGAGQRRRRRRARPGAIGDPRPISTRRGRPRGCGTCWSTGRSWCATANCSPTRCPAGPCGAGRADPDGTARRSVGRRSAGDGRAVR